MQNKNASQEIKVVFGFSALAVFFIVIINMVSLYHINTLHNLTEKIYKHPLKVSNAALNVQKGVLKIHRDMKDVVLSSSTEELNILIEHVNLEESNVYEYLKIIKENILGEEGKKLYQHTYKLFYEWRDIRESVILLVKKNEFVKAVKITKGIGATHVIKLENSAVQLNKYARNKAYFFQSSAHSVFENFQIINIILTFVTFIIFIYFTAYLIKRIKKYINSINELNERFELAIEGTNDGLWDWDLVTNKIYFSSRWKRMLGYSDSELENTLETWKKHVHPDDKESFKINMEGKTEVYENVHRLRHKDGSWVWILDRGKTLFDTNAKAIRMVGFHTDITKQKELELELIKNEKLYYDFFEHTKSANIMYTTDDNGKTFKIKALNSQVEELEGIQREEVIGKRVEEIFEGIEEFGLLDIFKDVYQSGEAQKTQIAFYVDGKRKGWRENYVFKLSNGDIVASYEDRTEEKKLDLLLSNILNSVNNLIFVKDNNFIYLECNRDFENFLGLSREEILGKSDYELFPKDVADFFRAKDEEMLTSKKSEYNYEWVTYPNGRKKYLLTVKSPLRDNNGEILGLVGNSLDMTEHKKLEDELKSSKEQFEQFMEFMPANIIMKENGLVVYANSKTNKFFNIESIMGKTVEELFSREKSQEIKDFEKKAYKYGFHEEILEILNPNNEIEIYRNMAFVIDDKIENKLGIVSINITREYQANREISRVLSAFERSDISVVITDLSGTISYVNPSWCRATGYSKKELIGQNPRIVKSGSISSKSYEKMWEELTSGRVWTSELKNCAKDGTEFWEDSTIMPSFDLQGAVDGYIAFKLDITDKINLRQELKNQEELMIAQSRHAAMGEMISMIAHQWRQPISVIAMDANNILADVELEMIDEESLESTSRDIIKQTQELSKTIDDFRNFFRPERVPQEVLVVDIIDDALGIIGKSLENNEIEITFDVDETLKLTTYSRELMQVFVNVIKNSKEALLDKEIEEKRIKISYKSGEEFLTLNICDNAGGIDKEIMEKIFDPYFTTKGDKNGTGLGLYMSKTIIQKHMKGKLGVYNIDGGVCFTIELPLSIDGGGDE